MAHPQRQKVANALAGIGAPLPSGRPPIQNPDGSISTERTVTLETPTGFANVPSIQGGAELPVDLVEMLYRYGLVNDVGTAPTVDQAETMAVNRSQALGKMYGTH